MRINNLVHDNMLTYDNTTWLEVPALLALSKEARSVNKHVKFKNKQTCLHVCERLYTWTCVCAI